MSIFDKAGKALGSSGKSIIGGAIGGPIGAVVAPAVSGGLPGIQNALTNIAPKVGLGTYKAAEYKPDYNKFVNNSQYDARRQDLSRQMDQTNMRLPRQVAPVNSSTVQLDQGQYGQTRGQQEALAQQLTDQGNGIGPSLAQGQLQQGRDLNIANAMALGASQRGLSAGQGLRNIGDQTANINQQSAQQAAQLRLQEQLQARQQLGGVLGTIGSQDLNLANANAGYANNMNQFNSTQGYNAQVANQQAGLNQTNLNDQMRRFYNSGLMTQDQNQQAANQGFQQLGANIQGGMNSANSSTFNNAQDRLGNFVSKAGQAIFSYL